MSHHFDSPTAVADGRINLCDVYVFPAAPGSTALIMTVNPDAGRSSATTFRPDARYEFVISTDGGDIEDLAFQFTFDEPDSGGHQSVRVRLAEGPAARHGHEGTMRGEGRTGEVFAPADGWLAWAGLAADPFSGDGAALVAFLSAIAEGRYAPDTFTSSPDNLFAGRDVTAIALQVPDSALTGNHVSVWARVILYGHAPQQQVSRMGQAMLRPLFFFPPDDDAEILNAGAPGTDLEVHGKRVRSLAQAVARLAGAADPDSHAERVTSAFLPDVLRYEPGRPARFHPGGRNGRALDDDAFAVSVALLTGSAPAAASTPRRPSLTFPFLNQPQPGELPALADLFGLRGTVHPDARPSMP